MSQNTTKPSPASPPWGLFAGVVAVFALWFAWFELIHRVGMQQIPADVAKLGQLGDSFAPLNTLFTGLAFGVVFWAGWLQRQDLALQKRALDAQETELQETRKVMARQTFESAFFQMLRVTRELHAAIRVGHEMGAEAVSTLARDCSPHLSDAPGTAAGPGVENLRDEVARRFERDIYARAHGTLGPYFRSLYHVFRFIDDQIAAKVLDELEARRYANIARAHLSAQDLILLGGNCCSARGAGFRKNVERFGLLKHYDDETSEAVARRCYAASAFETVEETSVPR